MELEKNKLTDDLPNLSIKGRLDHPEDDGPYLLSYARLEALALVWSFEPLCHADVSPGRHQNSMATARACCKR